ncbi:N-acetylglucosamine kinase [Lentibacillus sp. Marseille-P4043]|uniref:N-acetylglucosamine kinase n=1 Tax=Lentibacillus sp. Marseille-P4043 TaxID=2040293 RepID=UPI000D0BC0FB|nr:BadF/BadG/BcrA/BcrD ATPase family protein [Lentibacillus sp. Marseille-P4043]
MAYVIGIDGGGTNTRAVLADLGGEIYATAFAGSTNPNTVSQEVLMNTFSRIMGELENEAPRQYEQVITIFAGISGSSGEMAKEKIKQIIHHIVSERINVIVETDAINALYSGTYGEYGMVQIAGTGSVTYGVNQFQQQGRVGGWGYLVGDEGSGYAIGQQGIAASLKSFDGRGQGTVLLEMLYDYFQVTNCEQLVSHIYSSSSPKNEISSVAKLVFKAYKQKDRIAEEIIDDASKDLLLSVTTLYKKLFINNERVKLVLCGGIFSDPDILPSLIKSGLKKHINMVNVVIPTIPPVGGSIIAAYIAAGEKISEKTIHCLQTNFK